MPALKIVFVPVVLSFVFFVALRLLLTKMRRSKYRLKEILADVFLIFLAVVVVTLVVTGLW